MKKLRVLVVDDHEENGPLMKDIMNMGGFDSIHACNGVEALQRISEIDAVHLIISDVLMPRMDGYSFCRECKKNPILRQIPFLFYTATYTDAEDREFALSLGADRYLAKPMTPEQLLKVIGEVLEERSRKRPPPAGEPIIHDESHFLTEYNERLVKKLESKNEELQENSMRMKRILDGTVRAFSMIGELRDPYTHGHQKRVSQLLVAIGREMGVPETERELLRIIGLVHDIGKIAVPAEIFNKPSRLNDWEYDIVKTHAKAGYEILKDIEFNGPVAMAVFQHHERMDGSGYPEALKGREILAEARMLAVADVAEAMLSHRPYRPAIDLDQVMNYISSKVASLFDPDVASVCIDLFTRKNFQFEP